MEIITRGELPHESDPKLWWVGRVLECSNCKCKFRLERDDEPRVQTNIIQMGHRRELAVKCPTPLCGKVAGINEPCNPQPEPQQTAEPTSG